MGNDDLVGPFLFKLDIVDEYTRLTTRKSVRTEPFIACAWQYVCVDRKIIPNTKDVLLILACAKGISLTTTFVLEAKEGHDAEITTTLYWPAIPLLALTITGEGSEELKPLGPDH